MPRIKVPPKIGDTIQIRKPARFLIQDGQLQHTGDTFELKTLQTAEDVAESMEII